MTASKYLISAFTLFFNITLTQALDHLGTLEPTLNFYGESARIGTDKSIKHWIDQLIQHHSKSAPIIDVGCGLGGDVLYLLYKGFTNIYAIDLSDLNLNVIRKNIKEQSDNLSLEVAKHITFVQGEFPNKEALTFLPRQKWSMVIFKNVFHFMRGSKIEESLKITYDNLKNNGAVYIQVTNARAYDKKYLSDKYANLVQLDSNAKNNYINLPYSVKYFGEDSECRKYTYPNKNNKIVNFYHCLDIEQLSLILQNIGYREIQKGYVNQLDTTFCIVAFK